jgi:ribosome biogenesis GTPase A
LWDTPGMLWPRIIVAKSGYNLAASGAIGRNAFDEEEVALELLNYLKGNYAVGVSGRFKLVELDAATMADMKDEALLDTIGRKRGALLGKGKVNLQKSAEIVMHEFRAGNLGRVTLETPTEYAQWLAEGQRIDAERAAKKAARGSKKGKQKPEAAPEESA